MFVIGIILLILFRNPYIINGSLDNNPVDRKPVLGERDDNQIIPCKVEYKVSLEPKPPEDYKAITLSTHHPQSPVISVGSYQWVQLECDCCCDQDQVKMAAARAAHDELQRSGLVNISTSADTDFDKPRGQLQYRIRWNNKLLFKIMKSKKDHVHLRKYHRENNNQASDCKANQTDDCVEIYRQAKCVHGENVTDRVRNSQGFYIYAEKLGISDLTVKLLWVDKPSSATYQSETIRDELTENNVIQNRTTKLIRKQMSEYQRFAITQAVIFVSWKQIVKERKQINEDGGNRSVSRWEYYHLNQTLAGRWKDHIHVTIILKPQKFYLASEWSAIIIACMIALSVGCCNDPTLLSAYLRRPKVILMGMGCQLVAGPLFALIIGMCLQLDADKAFGMFATAVIPGGGIGYLLTYLVKGDRHLSAVLSLTTSWANIVTAPTWLYLVGWFWFKQPIHIGKSVAWLTSVAGTETLGTILRGFSPSTAFAILTWVTRPLLLLSGILLVTLGVYINHYAFTEFNQKLIIGMVCVITLGFMLGWILGQLDEKPQQQEMATAKALATECTIFNGLLCMPLLRTTVHAPQGDLAAVAPLWAIFLTPICLIYHTIATIIHRWITDYKQRRRKKYIENQQQMQQQTMLGPDMSATSFAAVTAAAIAVAPTITSRKKGKSASATHDQNISAFSPIQDLSQTNPEGHTTNDNDPVYFTAASIDNNNAHGKKGKSQSNSEIGPRNSNNLKMTDSKNPIQPHIVANPFHIEMKNHKKEDDTKSLPQTNYRESGWKAFFEPEQ